MSEEICAKLLTVPTTELEGGALPKFFGMEVMSMVYFSFQDLMSFGIFIVALLTFIFQNRK